MAGSIHAIATARTTDTDAIRGRVLDIDHSFAAFTRTDEKTAQSTPAAASRRTNRTTIVSSTITASANADQNTAGGTAGAPGGWPPGLNGSSGPGAPSVAPRPRSCGASNWRS